MSTQDCALDSIFVGLRSSRSQEVWAEFLGKYSALIFQTCQFSTSDADQASDCFLFACEQLSRNNFRRLLRFQPSGSASFSTWLRVVVRNLCLDWKRRQFGRPRLFRSLIRLPQLEVEVYRARHEKRLSPEETLFSLRQTFPNVTVEQLAVAEGHVHESMNARQRWLSSTPRTDPGIDVGVKEPPANDPADPRPNQEVALAAREEEAQLRVALDELSKPDRFLVRLRFEQDLTLEEIGRLTGLGDAQRVQRRIAEILNQLRNSFHLICGKKRTVSVK